MYSLAVTSIIVLSVCRRYPRNCCEPDLEQCSGYCIYGCRKRCKQSTDVTFLADAAQAGARVIAGSHNMRLTLSQWYWYCAATVSS